MVELAKTTMELKAPRSWLARVGSRVAYKTFGPTTVHLDHEVCLLVTATCLTSASLFSLYKLSFGSALDFFYLLISTLWLSRHFFHRLLCTTDVSTSLSGWTHNLRWIWITITSGGQYFDIPTHMFASTSFQPLIDDAYARPKSGGDVSSSIPITFSPFAFHRIWIVQKTVVPLLAAIWAVMNTCKSSSNDFDLYDNDWSSTTATISANNKRNKHSSNSGSDHARNKNGKSSPSFAEIHKKCIKKLNRKFDSWWQYVPRVQLLVLIITACGILWFFQKYNEVLSSYSLPLRTPRSALFDKNMANPRMVNAENNSQQNQRDAALYNSEFMDRRFDGVRGAKASSVLWSRNFVYSPLGMICMIMSLGTIASILLFGRIMPPLPDLVGGSGGNVGRGSHVSFCAKVWLSLRGVSFCLTNLLISLLFRNRRGLETTTRHGPNNINLLLMKIGSIFISKYCFFASLNIWYFVRYSQGRNSYARLLGIAT